MIIRVLAATVAGGIAFFFLGWLIFGLLLAEFMKAHTINYPGLLKEPMPDMIPLALANLAWAWLIAFIFDYWAGIKTFVGGLKGGALIMFPIILGIDLQFMAFMNLYQGFTPLIVDVIASTVLGAIAGGVIGLILGLVGKKAEAE
ncbi:hypothetical protein BH20ACI4_BH20ACI4_32620 [soil metagenome]